MVNKYELTPDLKLKLIDSSILWTSSEPFAEFGNFKSDSVANVWISKKHNNTLILKIITLYCLGITLRINKRNTKIMIRNLPINSKILVTLEKNRFNIQSSKMIDIETGEIIN